MAFKNTIRVKVLPESGAKFPTLAKLQTAVNEWVKSRQKSEVTGIRAAGNATKGYEAVITYHVVSARS